MKSSDFYMGYEAGLKDCNSGSIKDRIGTTDFVIGYSQGVETMRVALLEIHRGLSNG